MKGNLHIHIPKPCHEDWQKMTPAQQGRFCESCAKQVVDFSLMADQQILNYLANNSGKLCGRFALDQLQRPLQPIKQEKKKWWWVAAMMPVLMLFEKSNAQNKTKPVIHHSTKTKALKHKTYYDDKSVVIERRLTILGRVVDEQGNSVPFASIKDIATETIIAGDAEGNFQLPLITNTDSINILVSCIGHESVTRNIAFLYNKLISIELQTKQFQDSPVKNPECYIEGKTGGLVIYRESFLKRIIKPITRIFSPR